MSANDTTEAVDEIDPIANAIMQGGSGHDAPSSGADIAPESGADIEEAPEELILGKFKTADDVLEAYRNLEAYNTQQNQRLSELEALLAADDEDEYEAPRPWGVQFNGEPENEEQLVGWAERDPGQAAQWAIANADRVPKETVDGLWEHWFERKPTEAMAWYTQQQAQQVAQQYEQEIASLREQVAPLRDAQTQNMFEGALGSLEAQIPDLAEYSEKIQAYVDNIPVDQLHLAFFPNGMDTPEKVQEGVRSLYAIVRMREQPMQAQQQVQQQMQQNAFTQSRQGIVDTGSTDYDAKINDAILNA